MQKLGGKRRAQGSSFEPINVVEETFAWLW